MLVSGGHKATIRQAEERDSEETDEEDREVNVR
jgi:hypothetical protein